VENFGKKAQGYRIQEQMEVEQLEEREESQREV